VVDYGFNHTVTNGFRYNLLSFFDALNAQLFADISEGDLGVGDVDFLKSKLDDSVFQAVNETQVFVSLEDGLVLGQKTAEFLHVTGLDAAHNLEVRVQQSLELILSKDLSVGDFTHQKIHENKELVGLCSEGGCTNFRALAKSLNQTRLRIGVLKLNRLDTTNVVQVASKLVIRAALRESRLLNERTSLFNQVLLKVTAEDDVDLS